MSNEQSELEFTEEELAAQDKADLEAFAANLAEISAAVMGPPLGYVDLLNIGTDEAMKKELEAGNKFNPLRPSSAGKCTRELAYGVMEYLGKAKYPRPHLTPEMHRIFAVGHNLETHLIQQFRKHAGEFFDIKYTQQNLEFFKFEELEDERLRGWIEGSNDAVFWSKDNKCLVDFKSKKDKFSGWYSTNWDETSEKLAKMKTVYQIGDTGTSFWAGDLRSFLKELNDPFFESNFLQLNLYASHNFFVTRGIDHCAIIQINKNDSRLREVRFRPDPVMAAEIGEKFRRAAHAGEAGQPDLAPRDFMLGSIKCAFCDYKSECWPNPSESKDEDPLKTYFKTLPSKDWATDLSRLEPSVASALEPLFTEYETFGDLDKSKEVLEIAIAQQLIAANERKVKLPNGHVYELKHYKSPKPRVALKRSKQ